jgi:hypothetical protein
VIREGRGWGAQRGLGGRVVSFVPFWFGTGPRRQVTGSNQGWGVGLGVLFRCERWIPSFYSGRASSVRRKEGGGNGVFGL